MFTIGFMQGTRRTHFGWDWFSENCGNDKLKPVATARPLLLRGAERGVSIRRGHPILCRPRKLCQESIPAHRHPGPLTLGRDSQDASLSEGLQWAVTPKLTMIAGAGNFPSGRSRCDAPFSIQQ